MTLGKYFQAQVTPSLHNCRTFQFSVKSEELQLTDIEPKLRQIAVSGKKQQMRYETEKLKVCGRLSDRAQ